MRRFLDGLTLAAALYLWIVIACAGIAVPIGRFTLRSQKLENPAMMVLVLGFVRAAVARKDGAHVAEAPVRERGAGVLSAVWLCLLVPLAIVAWGRGFDGGFIREDFHRLEAVQHGAPWSGAQDGDGGLQSFWSRPVSLAVDALTYPVFGLDPRPWHQVNLALHLLVALLVGLTALELTGRRATAVLACALVALQPMAVEPVCWIAARDDLTAALFALVAALALARGARGLSALAFLAALFSKESVLSLPAALACVAWQTTPAQPRWARARAALAAVVPHALVLAAYLALRAHRMAGAGFDSGATLTDWQKVLLLPLSPLAPLAFPINMWSFAELAPFARVVVGGALLAGVALALARWSTLTRGPAPALYAMTLALTVPVYRMIHLSATLQNDRYLYLPGLAFAMLVAHLWTENARAWPRARLIPALALGACFCLARMNAEPWVAAGAVAARVNRDLAPVAEFAERETRVRLTGLPDSYRGAFLFGLSTVVDPMVVLYGFPRAYRWHLEETYHARTVRPPRAAGEPEVYWEPEDGFVLVPEPHSVSTRSLKLASISPVVPSGSGMIR